MADTPQSALTETINTQNEILGIIAQTLNMLATRPTGDQDSVITQMNRNRILQVNVLCVDLVANAQDLDPKTREWVVNRLTSTLQLLGNRI